ncbi:hypothetical protein TNCV_3297321 [Trichonephila clavipes]|uniref:Uncharacterized protein n=1 Tax=Trichonephila clavipes TaxID=2585209 RepID=A0A8X6VTC2_TRICX|nr:hypothetical protein TNCV_3297321 [Trichonephila clavipes]
MVEELTVSVEEYNAVNVKQTKGLLKLNQTCILDLKVGSLKGRNLINFSSSECSDLSLHVNPENKVKEGKKERKGKKDEINVVGNIEREEKEQKKNVLKFSNISQTDSTNQCTHFQIEGEDNLETKDIGENFELKEILECYEDVFAKDK